MRGLLFLFTPVLKQDLFAKQMWGTIKHIPGPKQPLFMKQVTFAIF